LNTSRTLLASAPSTTCTSTPIRRAGPDTVYARQPRGGAEVDRRRQNLDRPGARPTATTHDFGQSHQQNLDLITATTAAPTVVEQRRAGSLGSTGQDNQADPPELYRSRPIAAGAVLDLRIAAGTNRSIRGVDQGKTEPTPYGGGERRATNRRSIRGTANIILCRQNYGRDDLAHRVALGLSESGPRLRPERKTGPARRRHEIPLPGERADPDVPAPQPRTSSNRPRMSCPGRRRRQTWGRDQPRPGPQRQDKQDSRADKGITRGQHRGRVLTNMIFRVRGIAGHPVSALAGYMTTGCSSCSRRQRQERAERSTAPGPARLEHDQSYRSVECENAGPGADRHGLSLHAQRLSRPLSTISRNELRQRTGSASPTAQMASRWAITRASSGRIRPFPRLSVVRAATEQRDVHPRFDEGGPLQCSSRDCRGDADHGI